MRAEDADGFSGLNEECLVAVQVFERAHDGVERFPRPRRFPRASVDNEILGALGDIGIQVVQEHSQRRFLAPASARQ